MDDLDYVSYLGGVSVTVDPSSAGYIISPSHKAAVIKEKANDFLSTYQPQIEKMLVEFGSKCVRDLELCSTIVFVDRDAVSSRREMRRDDFVKEIKNIKPHFSIEEIEKALSELEGRGYIERRK